MLPTKIAKPNVLRIHPLDKRDVNSKNSASNDVNSEKSFNTKIPNKVPLKSDNNTFFEYSAKAMAKSEGSNERAESSMKYP